MNDDVVNEVESRKGGGGGFGGDKKGGYGMIAMAMMMKGAMGAMGKFKVNKKIIKINLKSFLLYSFRRCCCSRWKSSFNRHDGSYNGWNCRT